MSVTNKVSLTLAYKGTSYTRNYEFDVAQSALANVKAKVLAYNANVPAADKLVFISNDYDDSDPENIGTNGIQPEGYGTNGVYWTEEQCGNAPNDRRGLAMVGPFSFSIGDIQELDYAMITVWKNESLSVMERKGEFIDHVQTLFNNGLAK